MAARPKDGKQAGPPGRNRLGRTRDEEKAAKEVALCVCLCSLEIVFVGKLIGVSLGRASPPNVVKARRVSFFMASVLHTTPIVVSNHRCPRVLASCCRAVLANFNTQEQCLFGVSSVSETCAEQARWRHGGGTHGGRAEEISLDYSVW